MKQAMQYAAAAAAVFAAVLSTAAGAGFLFLGWTWVAEAYTGGGDLGVAAAFAAVGLLAAVGVAAVAVLVFVLGGRPGAPPLAVPFALLLLAAAQ